MAIDTATKRKSIAAISLIAIGPVVVPDSTIDAADRQVIGYSYSGIAAGEPVVNPPEILVQSVVVCVDHSQAICSAVVCRAAQSLTRIV